MAEVPVTINGVMFPKGRSATDTPIPCTIVGSAWITGLGVGGGPIIPPPGGPGYQPPVDPGYGYPERPVDPGWGYPEKPVDPGYGIPGPPYPQPPRPDQPPVQPGDPTTPVPPPPGSPGWPVSSMVPPDYITIMYPGIGPVYVAKPAP